MVVAPWNKTTKSWKVVEEGEWYREKSLDDGEVRKTRWVVDAWTIRVVVYAPMWVRIVALVP